MLNERTVVSDERGEVPAFVVGPALLPHAVEDPKPFAREESPGSRLMTIAPVPLLRFAGAVLYRHFG